MIHAIAASGDPFVDLKYFWVTYSCIRDLEDTWFGPWKYLLWGEWSECKHLDLVQNKLADDLKVKCKVEVHESLLRVILAGGKYACQSKECVSQLILNKGCYIGGVECNIDELSGAFELILETIHDIEEDVCVNREPIILVLDYEVQVGFWILLSLFYGLFLKAIFNSLHCLMWLG